MEMLQTKMDRCSFVLEHVKEWEVRQEREGGQKEEEVVVYALLHLLLPLCLARRVRGRAAAGGFSTDFV